MKFIKLLLAAGYFFGPSVHAENVDAWEWPRVFKTADYEIALYQPQVHEWKDFKHATVRLAVGVSSTKGGKKTFGAITGKFDTVADFEEKVVHIGERKITEMRFPDAKDSAQEKALQLVVRSILTPKRPLVMSLESMVSNVDRTAMQVREVKANLKPPPIYYSTSPTLLVMFLGTPKFEVVKGLSTTLFAINTNWDILLDAETSTYYLLAGEIWLSTTSLEKGPWLPVKALPEKFTKLPNDENWREVRAKLKVPAVASHKVPKIIVVDRPSELILTEGSPQLSLIPGTKLLFVENTESDLFLYGAQKKYFFLTAGRWFSAPDPSGPWSAETSTVPAEFAKIPASHQKGHVLVSVPGTAEAEEAVIMASIPQTATVNRNEITLEVKYEGDPKFVNVPSTDIRFAVNTSYDVFLVDGQYYCCHQGVWFEAATATGKWVVCTKVPNKMYSIPPESSKHNVTYVHVYESTPTTVTTGYTSGYNGAVISNGLLLFGLGYWIASEVDRWHYHYPPAPHYYGYGCAAVYNPYRGGYHRSGYRSYGPYGGAGGGAVYNPWTGGYARGGKVSGPRGGAGHRAAYNPWSDTAGARAGAKTPYGSWGRSAVVRDDEWARAGHRSSWRGGVSGIETSEGNAAAHVNRRYGPDKTVVKHDDDLYVGKNGHVYKRDEDGDWSNRKNGEWNDIPKPEKAPRNWNTSDRSVTRETSTTVTTNKASATNTKDVERRRKDVQRTSTRSASTTTGSKSSYQSKRSTSQQLDWDRRSRERSSHQRSSSASRSSSRSRRR